MKTAVELWDKHKAIFTDSMDEQYYIFFQSKFYDALAEHDAEIADKIDEKINEIRPNIEMEASHPQQYEWIACIGILTELKQWLQKEKQS